MDHVALFNELIKVIKVVGGEETRATSKDDNFTDIGLDSLDIVMLHMYVSELYGLDDEATKNIPVNTVEAAFTYAEKHGTRKPKSIEEAVRDVQ
jgi:acyl carrier protein